MLTECCECDKPAFRFWGRYAYCRYHFQPAKRLAPDAHSCHQCGEEQGRQVYWRRDKPCSQCLEKGA